MKGPQNPAQQDIPVLVCAEASPWNSVLEFGGKIQKGTDKRPTEREQLSPLITFVLRKLVKRERL